MDQVNVVLDGGVLPGIDPAVAQARLAKLLQRDAAFVAKLLCGRPITIKSGVDQRRGEVYLQALRESGVGARLEPSVLLFDEHVWNDPAPIGGAGGPPPRVVADMPRDASVRPPTGLARLRATKGWKVASAVVGVLVLVGAVGRLAMTYWPAKGQSAPIASAAQRAPDRPRQQPESLASPQSAPTENAVTTAAASPPRALASATGGFEIDRVVALREPTPSERETFASSPAGGLIGAADSAYVVVAVDLDDDGQEEYLLTGFTDTCGSGGCSTVVLKRSQEGFTMLELDTSTQFASSGELAVLKQSKHGFRLLAEVSGGKLATGDKPGTPLYGKALVREVKQVVPAPALPRS